MQVPIRTGTNENDMTYNQTISATYYNATRKAQTTLTFYAQLVSFTFVSGTRPDSVSQGTDSNGNTIVTFTWTKGLSNGERVSAVYSFHTRNPVTYKYANVYFNGTLVNYIYFNGTRYP